MTGFRAGASPVLAGEEVRKMRETTPDPAAVAPDGRENAADGGPGGRALSADRVSFDVYYEEPKEEQ